MEHKYAEKSDIGRNHQQIAVSKIYEPENSIHHGVTNGQQTVEAANGKSENNLLENELRFHRLVPSKDLSS